MKWSSRMLCSGVGRISELWKGPFGEWWNQNSCYGNHAIGNVSEHVFDLDWWNLLLPQCDCIRRVNRGGAGSWTITTLVLYRCCISLTLFHNRYIAVSLQFEDIWWSRWLQVSFGSRMSRTFSIHLKRLFEYLHGHLTRTSKVSLNNSNVSFRRVSAVQQKKSRI